MEENHYSQLNMLLDEFDKYAIGKYTLAQMVEEKKRNPSFHSELGFALSSRDIVKDNSYRRIRYEKLMEEIRVSFRVQLRKGLQFDKTI